MIVCTLLIPNILFGGELIEQRINKARGLGTDQPANVLAVGTNLTGIADWSTQMPFIDAFKSSRKWFTQCQSGEHDCSGGWDTQEYDQLELDENGWIKSLPNAADPPKYTRVATLLFRDVGRYPGGQYVVLYDGVGNIEYGFDAKKNKAASTPGRDIINVRPSNAGIHLVITETDPEGVGEYIRNIRVIPKEFESVHAEIIFNPAFLNKINKFQSLRFMDWMNTNNSEQGEWNNRPRIENASYSYNGGVPIELMVKLANKTQSDPWFNMPHKATDEYIESFARLVKKNAAPELTVYVEYSNEVWNSQFEQYHWVRDNGVIKGQKYPFQSYGVRSAQMCDIWKNVFGENSTRLKCVMGTQTANHGVASEVLNCKHWSKAPCYKHGIDALAITGYFSGNLGYQKNEETVMSWLNDPNVDEYAMAINQLKYGETTPAKGDSISDLKKTFKEYVDYLNKTEGMAGLELVVYEGGSHVVGIGSVVNNKKLTDFFIELHRKPEFYDLYKEVLNSWKSVGGQRTLFMNFQDIGHASKWGSWGALESVTQEGSPRYNALIDFIEENR